MNFEHYARDRRVRIESALEEAFARLSDTAEPQLLEAMRYSVLGGGKRTRALLAYAVADTLDAPHALVDDVAVAVELIHAYSLVHDDLPAMDDDDLRRGKPSCHKAFDEATAILAGDALQTQAFLQLAASRKHPPDVQVQLIASLTEASGAMGMVSGQMRDMLAENTTISLEALTRIHHEKTGALITAAIDMAAIACGATEEKRRALTAFGESLGLLFQIKDDLLDITANSETLGKPAQSDIDNHKTTFPSLLGHAGAEEKLARTKSVAETQLQALNVSNSPLHVLLEFVCSREH